MPDMCMPMMDGDCTVHCPAACMAEDMICPGGRNWEGEMHWSP